MLSVSETKGSEACRTSDIILPRGNAWLKNGRVKTGKNEVTSSVILHGHKIFYIFLFLKRCTAEQEQKQRKKTFEDEPVMDISETDSVKEEMGRQTWSHTKKSSKTSWQWSQ